MHYIFEFCTVDHLTLEFFQQHFSDHGASEGNAFPRAVVLSLRILIDAGAQVLEHS